MPSTSTYRRLPDEDKSTKPTIVRRCVQGYGLLFVIVVVVVGLLQEGLFLWATMGCKTSELKDYSYPGGGPENLVHNSTLLIEQTPRLLSSSFLVQPADNVGLATGASTGIWYRTWGPLFWTYVYQDNLGKATFWARDRPLALGASHKIARCDGTGPIYIINEGTHVVMNAIRHWFGMYTSRIYNIKADGNLVAIAETIGGSGQSHKQLIFREPEKATNPFASAFLAERNYHGEFDKWFISEDKPTLPAWVINAATVLRAFPAAVQKEKAATAAKAAQHPHPTSLEAVPPAAGSVEASKIAMAEVPAVEMAAAPAMAEVPAMAEIPVAAAAEETQWAESSQLEQHI